MNKYVFDAGFFRDSLNIEDLQVSNTLQLAFLKYIKGDEPIITASADGTLYVDGELLTTVVKDAAALAVAKAAIADAAAANANAKAAIAQSKADLADAAAANANAKAAIAQSKADLANAAADRANDLSDHPMFINTDNYHWMKWNEDSEAYVDTGIMASCSPYATFEINMLTGQLIMETDSYYAGPTFSLNNGNLVFTI